MVVFERVVIVLFALAATSSFARDANTHDLGTQELGTVHFPVSCAPGVQKTFERGVALLHSFAFETAEATFRSVAKDDPGCAMAHWGSARSFWRWDTPNAETRKRGWQEVMVAESLHPRTKREQEYIESVAALYNKPESIDDNRWKNYLDGLQRLHSDFPNDTEATAFYAAALIPADRADDPTHQKRRQAAALLEPLFASEPNHPGVAHYLIHAYDTPDLAPLGLPAARRYAKIAPAAPHALHMSSHIFARLGLWQEDINSNLASVAASRNAAAMHMGDEGHQFHAMEFLMYAYLQCGREDDAKRLIEEVRTLPKMKDMYGMGYDPRISAIANYSATYALELHDWKMAASLPELKGEEIGDLADTYFVRALGAAHTGRIDVAKEDAAKMEDIRARLLQQHRLGPASAVEDDRKTVLDWIDHVEGRDDEAIKDLKQLAAKDDGMFSAEGELPRHEILADLLLELNRPEEAVAEYEAELKINRKRFDSLFGAGLAAEKSNQPAKADNYYQQLLQVCSGSKSVRPELAHAHEFVSKSVRNNSRSGWVLDAPPIYLGFDPGLGSRHAV